MMRLEPASTLLLIVDVQEKLAAAMPQDAVARLVQNTCILLDAAKILGVRVVATEQYRRGSARRSRDRGEAPSPAIDKLASALSTSRVSRKRSSRLHARARSWWSGWSPRVRLPIARDLAARGYATYVVEDAVASRREENRLAGLALCERAGAIRTVTETVAFDWVRRAEGDAFQGDLEARSLTFRESTELGRALPLRMPSFGIDQVFALAEDDVRERFFVAGIRAVFGEPRPRRSRRARRMM